MEFTAGDRAHFAAPAAAPAHYPVGHAAAPARQASQPYHYYSSPNPNPYPIAPPGTTTAYEPEPDPYAPYGGYEAYHAQQAAYQGYQAPAAAAAAAASYGYPPAAAANSSYPSPAAAGYYQATAGGVEGQSSRHNPWPRKNTVENLEVKKQKLIEGGTPADAVRVCVVCNVVCNSASVFASHLAGEKHTSKVNGQYGGARATVPTQAMPANKYLKPSKTIAKVVQSVYCDVCKLECNTKEVLAIHKVGKKHMKNLKKLQDSLMRNPASVAAPSASSGVTVTAVQQQKKPPADLEALKQRIVENGTSADSIRVCDVCQVVCPSQIVFNSHVAGQKHLMLLQMVQQQQQEQLAQQQQQEQQLAQHLVQQPQNGVGVN